jgi:hypothetical protein
MASVDAFKETYSREIVKDASRALLAVVLVVLHEATSCINHANKTTVRTTLDHCCCSPKNLEPFLQILHSAANINTVIRSVIADARVCVVMIGICDHYSSSDLARALFNLLDLFIIESSARKFARASHVAVCAFDARCARFGSPNCSFFHFFLELALRVAKNSFD